MKVRSNLSLRLLAMLALAIIGNVVPVSAAEQAPPAAAPEPTDEQKALLKALDSELVRFGTIIAKVDDAKYVEFLKGQLDLLTKRRDAFIKIAFDSGKYDELRYDLNVDIQRASQWLLPPLAPAAAPKK